MAIIHGPHQIDNDHVMEEGMAKSALKLKSPASKRGLTPQQIKWLEDANLSEMQASVMVLKLKGMTEPEIAKALGVVVGVVAGHRKKALRWLAIPHDGNADTRQKMQKVLEVWEKLGAKAKAA